MWSSSDTSGEKKLIGERKESLMTLARFVGLVFSPPSIFLSVDTGSDRVVGVIPQRVFMITVPVGRDMKIRTA